MKTLLYRLFSFESFIPVAILSLASWYVFYLSGLTLSYNDAMSHLNIARLVVDNQNPGLSQIGSVWLPLNHILPVVLVWNDWAWRTGFAASFFSMVSYVVATWAIFQLVVTLTGKKTAAMLGGLAFATNMNMLYLQATPLTEPLYVVLFTLSCLFFTYWLKGKQSIKYLFILGFLGFLQVLTRYDGWFVVMVEGLIIGWHELFLRQKSLTETIGRLLLFATPVAFGIGMWLLWNFLIFGNALFFAFGPYSAHAQQATIEQHAALITKGNLWYAFLAYFYAMRDNVGMFALALSGIGVGALLFSKKISLSFAKRVLLLVLLTSPILFNIIALYFGFSILNLPELHWNPSGSPEGNWFNVRYGILALPFAAIAIGSFASLRKLAVIIALEILLLQGYAFYAGGVITITDGTIGSSAFRNTGVATELKNRVKPTDTVLMSISSFNPIAFDSDLALHQFIHEGVSKKWNKALKDPSLYAEWVVMSSTNDGEPVRKALVVKKNQNFLSRYKKVYQDKEAVIYHLKGA